MTMDGKGTRIVQLIDLTDTRSNPDGTLTRNEQEVSRGEMCYFASPYDMPMYLRFWRRLVDRSDKKRKIATADNLGTTMEIDAYTFGVKFYVKYDRAQKPGDPTKLTLICEDGDGREVLVSYER
jgi:hypothetical protein